MLIFCHYNRVYERDWSARIGIRSGDGGWKIFTL